MVASMEGPSNIMCVVCAKVVRSSMVSVHASLVAQNGSIHNQLGQVVGVEQLEEACRVSELVCSICLKLLLSIVNLECKLVVLKNEFQDTFLQGVKSRRGALAGGKAHFTRHSSVPEKRSEGVLPQAEVWDSTHLDQCVRPEKVEGFFSNIPLDSENNMEITESSEAQVDDKAEDAISPVKCETSIPESSEVTSQQCPEGLHAHMTLDTSAAELSDLLHPHCLLGDDAVSCVSQGEEETPKEAMKRSESDICMQHYSGSPDTIRAQSAAKSALSGAEDEKACRTEATEDNQESRCLLSDSGGDDVSEGGSVQPAQRRVRRPRGKGDQYSWQPGVHTLKRRKRRPDAAMDTVEVKMEAEDEWTLKETGRAQLGESHETCELCGRQFSNTKELGHHRREEHSAVYCHVCQWCPNTCYREKSKLTQHLRRNHYITAHQCPGCAHQAVSQNALDQHIIRQHPESRFFECHICHKAFRTHRYLQFVHIKRCHMGLPVKYSCEKCNKGFVDKSSYENHKVTHSEARNFTCEFCGARFLTPYALKVHVNTHTREKKYECEDCGSAFLRMCNLCAHRKRFHSSSDVKLVCEICGKSMATRKDLRRHQVAQHSKEKPFRCPQCARSYAAKESLKSHLRTHTGEKPYVCACGKAFHKSNLLRRHQRCVHEGEDL